MNKFGFSDAQWSAAKAEAKKVLIEHAKKGKPIFYSELAPRIQSVSLQADDMRLFHLLGEISEEENAAGRGMLSAFVVHKDSEEQPGPGFFELAKQLGKDTSDPVLCLVQEQTTAHTYWSKH
jgi:hypothetical protein